MGHAHGSLSGLILAALCTVLSVLACPASAQDIGTHAKIRAYTMPQYTDDNGFLQFIVYGKTADNKGALLALDHMVIDFMRPRLKDINSVKLLSKGSHYERGYERTSDPAIIRNYWKERLHSQGLVFSNAAILDKNTQVLRSNQPVFFRSPFLDVDGVGFDAYQHERFLHIRSDVKVTLRIPSNHGLGTDQSKNVRKSAEDYLKQDSEQKSNTQEKE